MGWEGLVFLRKVNVRRIMEGCGEVGVWKGDQIRPGVAWAEECTRGCPRGYVCIAWFMVFFMISTALRDDDDVPAGNG